MRAARDLISPEALGSPIYLGKSGGGRPASGLRVNLMVVKEGLWTRQSVKCSRLRGLLMFLIVSTAGSGGERGDGLWEWRRAMNENFQ
jgi:hypothetical protein